MPLTQLLVLVLSWPLLHTARTTYDLVTPAAAAVSKKEVVVLLPKYVPADGDTGHKPVAPYTL